MDRIKNLGRYQKGVLILMAAMALVFAVIYPVTLRRVGFAYKDTILVQSREDGSTVYAGKLRGQQARFTVSEDKTVLFQLGDQTYGPYTAREDPSAVPDMEEMADYMTGVEVRRGEDILFRGGVWGTGDQSVLFDADGIAGGVPGDGADPDEPSVSAILQLMGEPELTHKGEGLAWFGAVFICVLNALAILFADELFRWQMSFRIRNADQVEPAAWEIAERYIVWTLLPVMALVIFVTGLL